MNGLENVWNNLPFLIDPIAFTIGFFSVRWYSMMLFAAFIIIYSLVRWRIRNDKDCKIPINLKLFDKLFLYLVIGLLVGARLGYALIYDPGEFLSNPLSMISPFSDGRYVGFFGLSFHGGLIGAIIGGMFFCKKYKIELFDVSDLLIPALPLGYFFGRLGNFLNGELYGRPTNSPIGMYFPSDPQGLPRHPSQLYEAIFEGLILFLILWPLRNKHSLRKKFLPLFLILYGTFRFFIEFFRAPDSQLGLVLWGLSMGQLLSLAMIIAGVAILMFFKKNLPKSQPISKISK